MMRVCDYAAEFLAGRGVRDIFMVSGGGAMFLNDALGHHPRLRVVCTHHEQAAAMAAECHARLIDAPGVVNVTSGPGAINALNGVFGAWVDSVPMLVLSGQVKRETLLATYAFQDCASSATRRRMSSAWSGASQVRGVGGRGGVDPSPPGEGVAPRGERPVRAPAGSTSRSMFSRLGSTRDTGRFRRGHGAATGNRRRRAGASLREVLGASARRGGR